MVNGRTIVKKPFLAGNTIRIRLRILDENRAGFVPDTLTMSVYDVQAVDSGLLPTGYACSCPVGPTVESVIVNDQNGADVIGFIDSTGQVELFLTPDDTAIDVPTHIVAIHHQRRILFTWTWDSPEKRASHEIFISLAPDRATVAA